MFTKVLIANRGEIAARVIRSAAASGYATVAVYSEADQDAPHVTLADEAVCIGEATVAESYLNSEKILHACEISGADAVHPGYGFLSENAEFARQCETKGITFIGPPTAAIELMGSKRLSKIAMLEADVPCIPGYEGEAQDDDTLIKEAKAIGFPVMIKASAGGGGRGMRLAENAEQLPAQLKTARSEAQNSFGSGELILEKAVIQPRHIEIQVFCDKHGNAVYLGERDCSIQRRHQKVVEEAPSPFVSQELRQRMGKAAVQAAQSCNYVGAGTVEFLVDANHSFYFLEMNTRLQVEHPVTEMITGLDLVDWQLQIAAGEPLPLHQEEIQLDGHAMEVRLYAEDPAAEFMPQTGKIIRWDKPVGEGVRIDDGIRAHQTVSPHYDPMLAKVICHGKNREEARRRLVRTLEQSTLFGVTTNQHFLRNILWHQTFIDGQATTAFLAEHFQDDPSIKTQHGNTLTHALAAVILLHHQYASDKSHFNWWSAQSCDVPYELRIGENLVELSVATLADGQFKVNLGASDSDGNEQKDVTIRIVDIQPNSLLYTVENVRKKVDYAIDADLLYLKFDAQTYCYQDLTHEVPESESSAGDGTVLASMDGAIVDIQVESGQSVTKGQTLVVLEAMKMEHPLVADCSGVVETVSVKPGDQVKIRQVLVQIRVVEGETG